MIITEAQDGKQAIDIFKEKIESNICQFCDFFKLIIMDLNMPITNGDDATKIILQISKDKAIDKPTNRNLVKIIAASAYTDMDSKNLCQEAGMLRFMNKPLKNRELVKNLLEIGCLTIKNSDL